MDGKVLVAYASESGSTGGIAEAIGKQLASNGTAVDVMPIKSVTDLSPYRSFVIGSAVHNGEWMPEAIQFLRDHQQELKRKPTAFFLGCLMATNQKKNGQWIEKFLDSARAVVKPVAEGAFAGAYWPEKYPSFQTRFGLWIFTRYIKISKGDYRDWNAISTWAEGIRPLVAA